ncbi:pyridine nucleotide-disulfide oxidoreductase family protein [Collimonas arenae]|uniref:Pyridine nucleotide-disulfide oxidoreductase family protein n=1 Tax=Collimonas arenae TaxID=279058 RepID=A0A127QMH4_9BURK|nr:bifunctional protein tyrosine phosphatase family protein/NAD(P)/FAD-dependent oxidoreductase [Collimonas arenae]AMP01141.1 pyridine nucleotide-disulfide oxidoreductase family protein [Collimonas arenae]AMP11035.1 pyridine nucleotide-disulfide oxidoreductase family protein [Collimonas arenae]
MNIPVIKHSDSFSTTSQICREDLIDIAAAGYKSVICNRPDNEDGGRHVSSSELAVACASAGLAFSYLPAHATHIDKEHGEALRALLAEMPGPTLAFCRTGNRSTNIFRMANIIAAPGDSFRAEQSNDKPQQFEVVIVGGGSAGIAVASSLLRRAPNIQIAVIEPCSHHYYQPAWTLVGAGAFRHDKAVRPMASLMPEGVHWIRNAVSAFLPDHNRLQLDDGQLIGYQQLIVCTGLRLAWEKIEGLKEALGKNGVTSNYRHDLAPYTWQLVSQLKRGTALFSQPAMPIKCAGAPQKAMYLSCDHWLRKGRSKQIEVEFNSAGTTLFGVAAFVPSLMRYVEKYGARLAFESNLVKVDGERKLAWFEVTDANGNLSRERKSFDMLHAVPPQVPPDAVRNSPLANAEGWCEVDPASLRHVRYRNVFALGDICSTANAKTVAAIRKQAVVVADNLLAACDGLPLSARYDGYGACPLTVERGKVILAEFGYGGKLLPTFRLDPTVARRSHWFLKTIVLPWVYWKLMLKGREWLTKSSEPAQKP